MAIVSGLHRPRWPVALSRDRRSLPKLPSAHSEEPGMPRVRGLLVVTFLVASCASCSGSADSPAAETPTGTTTIAPSSPTPTVPSGLATYSADERAAFTAAVSALHHFSTVNDRFLGQGELTKHQADFYRRNSLDWVADWANLSQFVNKKITFDGRPNEVWLRPVSIDLAAKDGYAVEVKRCLDQSGLRVFANGKKIPEPQLKVPHVYRVSVVKRSSETWWRIGQPKQGSTC